MKKIYALILIVVLTFPLAAVQVSASAREDGAFSYILSDEYDIVAPASKAGTYGGTKYIPSYGKGRTISALSLYVAPFNVGKDLKIQIILGDGYVHTLNLSGVRTDHNILLTKGFLDEHKSKSLTIKVISIGDRDKDITVKLKHITFRDDETKQPDPDPGTKPNPANRQSRVTQLTRPIRAAVLTVVEQIRAVMIQPIQANAPLMGATSYQK